jgi:hypothetical protein
MKIPILQFLVLVVIVWFGSVQNTYAVNPPPNGGYPLGNTAEGDDALFSLTANGAANRPSVLMRSFSIQPATTNTAVGFVALNFNTTGSKNTALGYHALFSNQTGRANTATGFDALNDNTHRESKTLRPVSARLSATKPGAKIPLAVMARSPATQSALTTSH